MRQNCYINHLGQVECVKCDADHFNEATGCKDECDIITGDGCNNQEKCIEGPDKAFCETITTSSTTNKATSTTTTAKTTTITEKDTTTEPTTTTTTATQHLYNNNNTSSTTQNKQSQNLCIDASG